MMMPFTTGYRRGDLILVSFPFTDLIAAKRRPALVVSPDFFNELNGDLTLPALTSWTSSLRACEACIPDESTVSR